MSNTLLLTIKQNHLSCPQNSRMILGKKTQVFYLQQIGREEIIDLCQSSNYICKTPHEKYLNRIRISLLSLKLQIWRLLRARSSLTFRQIIECSFTLKFVLDMIITFSQKYLCRRLFYLKNCRLKVCRFVEKRLQHRCFSVNFAKFFENTYFRKICGRMFLNLETIKCKQAREKNKKCSFSWNIQLQSGSYFWKVGFICLNESS